ncbi:MAG TPA: dihydroorotate dehydrogenase-like protein [Thermoanaerobaculia bacterium]|nr:dihydroorotate dehydrogenase-like protein [Thermoanaerobaculia bacterium]
MDLSTEYLGFELPHPLMPGASPLVDDMDMVRRLEDSGAAAIVMHSLFEEQISSERREAHLVESHEESFAEAVSYTPDIGIFALGPDEYLEQIQRIRRAVSVPVIASLNGTTPDSWIEYARLIEQAGAQALEINVYYLATDPLEEGEDVEARTLGTADAVKGAVSIPVAVKLSPFFSSFSNLAGKLDKAGADGLVIFNRFYQPDIDIEALDVLPTVRLSDSGDLLLRLRWLAILSGRVRCSLAVTGGVHTAGDAIKAVMAGAHAIQMVSALLRRGPEHLRRVREEMSQWMEEHGYDSLRQMQGSMSLANSGNPGALERANYMRILQSWRG